MSTGNCCKYFVCPVLLVSVLCDICVLFCRLNTFRWVLDAEMKDLTADVVALKTKRAEKVGISAEKKRCCGIKVSSGARWLKH